MNKLLIIPAYLDSYRSLKDKSLKLVFETNEPTPEQLQMIATCFQFPGFLAFSKDVFKKEQKQAIESLESDADIGKSKSQRLRAVLYRSWEQNNLGYDVFDDYYNHRMEKLITLIKNKLD